MNQTMIKVSNALIQTYGAKEAETILRQLTNEIIETAEKLKELQA